jgi:hypothetical protein
MKTTGIALLSAASLLGAASANAAENLPWTFAEFGYTRVDGTEDFETEAFSVLGSIGFMNVLHAQLEYTDGESDSDFFSDDPDFDGFRVTAGAHPQISDNTQFRLDATYFDYDGGEGSFDFDSKGYGLGFGIRHAFSSKFEGTAQAWYVEGDTDSNGFFGNNDQDFNDTIIEFQGRYNWTPNLSTGLTVSLNGGFAGVAADDSSDSARFDVRWAFGNNGFSDLK